MTRARGRIAGLHRKHGAGVAQERRDLERTVTFWRALLATQGLGGDEPAEAPMTEARVIAGQPPISR
jgi:hypothetical protein